MSVGVTGQHYGVIGVRGRIGVDEKRAQRPQPQRARERCRDYQAQQDEKKVGSCPE